MAYVFRSGGFWQIQKSTFWPQGSDAIIPVPPPPPPPTPPVFAGGGPPYRMRKPARRVVVVGRHDWEAIESMYALGEIDEEEYAALLGDEPGEVIVIQ